MKNTICKSQTVSLECLNNLFIELTAKNCSQKCRHCYINFPQFKKVQDFIKIETVSKALEDLSGQNISCIYLTGAEPMTHPDFNAILRLCLKKANVCICTNGSFINEKKTRFLKKVENETENEIFFEISLDHWDEIKNDEIRYRGAYRHAVFAIKHLWKYNFTPIIHCVNYYNEPFDVLYNNIINIFAAAGCDLEGWQIKITPYHDVNSELYVEDWEISQQTRTDCRYGRVLTAKGVYSCPFLSNDYRGRCGKDFSEFSKNVALETNFCLTCLKNECEIFGINPQKNN